MTDPSGKRARFETTALPLLGVVHRHAVRLTRDAEVARDLVQETCLRAYRTFDNFRPGTNCRAWLLTILHSIFVNRYRKERREPRTVSLEELEERFHRSLESGDSAPELALTTWTDPEVETALEELPDSFRAAVLLVDVEEFSYEEAAAALGCPVGTVRSRLSRARRILCAALQEHARRRGYLKEQAQP